jgi:hypothetical protein
VEDFYDGSLGNGGRSHEIGLAYSADPTPKYRFYALVRLVIATHRDPHLDSPDIRCSRTSKSVINVGSSRPGP